MSKSHWHRHKGRIIAAADKFHLDHPKSSRFGLLNTKRFFEAESKIATDYTQKSLVRWSLITCHWRSIWLTLHILRPTGRMDSVHCGCCKKQWWGVIPIKTYSTHSTSSTIAPPRTSWVLEYASWYLWLVGSLVTNARPTALVPTFEAEFRWFTALNYASLDKHFSSFVFQWSETYPRYSPILSKL